MVRRRVLGGKCFVGVALDLCQKYLLFEMETELRLQVLRVAGVRELVPDKCTSRGAVRGRREDRKDQLYDKVPGATAPEPLR